MRNIENLKIGQIAKVKGGKRLPKGMEVQDDITEHPYLRIVDFSTDGVDRSNIKYISNEAFEFVKRYTISKDDVYISIAGTIGRVGIVPADLSGANLTENAAKITEIDSLIDKNFLMYFLRSPLGQGSIQSKTGGTSQPKLALFRIEEIEFPFLPTIEQKRIAEILSTYDDLIENNLKRIRLLEESARLLYREWFVRLKFPSHEHTPLIDGLPEGWKRKTLADLCESINYGYTASAQHDGEGVRFLRITDIVPSSIDWATVPFCEIPDEKKEQFLLKEGDIVIARTGATVGYAKRLHKRHPESVFASYLVRLRLKEESENVLAGIFVESDEYKNYIQSQINGAAQPNANAKVLSGARLLVPTKNIQEQFREIVEPMFDQKEILLQQNQKLKQARDLLLPRLMNGEIVI